MRRVNRSLYKTVLFLTLVLSAYPADAEEGKEGYEPENSVEQKYYERFNAHIIGLSAITGYSSSNMGKGQRGLITGGVIHARIWQNLRLAYTLEYVIYFRKTMKQEEVEATLSDPMRALLNGVGIRYDIDDLPVTPYLGVSFLFSHFGIPEQNFARFYAGYSLEVGLDVPITSFFALGLRVEYAGYFGMETSFPATSGYSLSVVFRQF